MGYLKRNLLPFCDPYNSVLRISTKKFGGDCRACISRPVSCLDGFGSGYFLS